ncbi:hypothetical protein ACU82A_00780 [Bacillus cereus]
MLTYTDTYKRNGKLELKIDLLDPSASEEETQKYYENQAYKKYVQNRLERMGLLGIVAHSSENGMESIENVAKTEIGINTFGRHLIDFFQFNKFN